MRKSWMLASALLLATACGDDSGGDGDDGNNPGDGGTDAARPDGGANIDGGEGNIDSGTDATAGDGAIQTDSTVNPNPGPNNLEIVGQWNEVGANGKDLLISTTMYGTQTIIEIDYANRTMITQSPASDELSPNRFNKQAWTSPVNNAFYQCTQDFNHLTAADAKASTMLLDRTNPAMGGCRGATGAWSQYVPSILLIGNWQSSGAAFRIDSRNFGTTPIERYDNDRRFATLVTGAGAAATYGKVVWNIESPTRALYCIVTTGQTTAALAADAPNTADATQPTTGCNGAAWTVLTK